MIWATVRVRISWRRATGHSCARATQLLVMQHFAPPVTKPCLPRPRGAGAQRGAG
jgi:hypothetical protein